VAPRRTLVTFSLGSGVVARVRRRVGPGLAPIADGLLRVEATFGTGEEGEVGAVFFYDDDRHASDAAERGRDVVRLLADKLTPHLEFLRAGLLVKTGRTVQLTARLPPALLRRFAEVEDLPAP
jgi:hypothetical protein